jgi:hypothetical protein|tara:strand:- start:1200 stop:2042 length:843 start_codon:yes stop_codon:yes gene_type:complete
MTRVVATGKETGSNFSPANGTGSVVRTAIKDVLESLRTVNSASGDPSGAANLAAFQLHIDSDTNLLKIRNAANSAFITLGNVSQTNLGLLPLTGGTLSGVLSFTQVGSASAPSLNLGDSTTGLFRRASNQVGFSFAGTERIFFDQNGVNLKGTKAVRFFDNDDSHYIELKAGTVTSNRAVTFPDAAGTLVTEGSLLTVLQSQNLSLRTLLPQSNNSFDLGSSTLRWANLFVNDFNLSNEGHKNDVDGTWGSYTIQEGHEDLFLLNKRTGKKFKFVLQEVD